MVALIFGCFGLIRGLEPLATIRVKRPDQLVGMLARLDRWRVPARRAAAVLLSLGVPVAIIGSIA